MMKIILALFFSGVFTTSVHQTDEIHLDWRTKDVILPVPQEDPCVHTSIINTLDMLSAMNKIQKGTNLIKLSRQQVYDCYDGGIHQQKWCPCGKAGNFSEVLDVLRTDLTRKGVRGVMDYDVSYPYNGQCSTKCKYTTGDQNDLHVLYEQWSSATKVGDYENIYEDNLKRGPFVVAVNNCEDLHDYEEGILDTDKCKGELNHSLLLVGYGTVTTYTGYKNKKYGVKQDYWIARNNRGIGWGEEGYVRIARNKNVCRIGALYAAIQRMENYDRTLVNDDGTPIVNN